MAWNDGIYAALTGSPPLVLLVPVAQIWYSDAPPNASVPGKETLPNLVFWSVGGPGPQYNAPAVSGAQYTEEIQFQVDIYTDDPDQARAIEGLVDGLLNLKILPFDTARGMRIMRTSPREVLLLEDQPSPDDLDVWHVPLIYQLMLQRGL